MKEVTKAYLAGLMDGEGCFRIEKYKSRLSPIGVQYRCVVEISMCDREPLELMAQVTNRNFQKDKTLPSGRICYKLVWRNGPAAELIRLLLPYLICKKDEAALCLHYEDNVAPGRGRTYTAEDAILCEKLRCQVRDLKKVNVLRC